MPKATRQQIKGRAQVDLSSVGGGGGSMGVPAATRADAMAGRGGSYVSRGDSSAHGFAQLSGTLKALLDEQKHQQRLADVDAREAAREAKAEAKAREAEMKAQQAALDRINGAAAGIQAQREADERSRSGEWDLAATEQNYMERFSGESPAFLGAAQKYLEAGMASASDNTRGKALAESEYFFRSQTRQTFHDIHGAYTPDDPEGYAEARRAIYEGRNALGISGSEINKLEMDSLSSQIRRLSTSDPIRAQALLDLAYQKRPDGTPSLAASLPGGYDSLNTLQDELDTVSLKASATEARQAAETLKESTQDRFSAAMIALARADTPEAVEAWADQFINNMDDTTLKGNYGEHRAGLVAAYENRRRGIKQEGNQAAVAEYSNAIQRGTAEWDSVNSDPRLNDIQRAQLFETMRSVTQQAALGYVTDGQLAVMLLGDLEKQWPQSIYGTPWNASRVLEPGKPPEVTAEGHYYQGEPLKRLRQVDPNLNVVKSNTMKREITQDVANEILSGKLRWANNKGSLNVPVPQLKLSEKVKAGERLNDREVQVLGKAFNQGGAHRILDSHGLNFFTLDSADQRRIAGEAQRQKAELTALREQTWSYRIFGDPDSKVEALEWERQQNEEAARLALEGLEMDRRISLGLPAVEPEAETAGEDAPDTPDIPDKKTESSPVKSGGALGEFFGNIGNLYGSQMMITP